MRKALTSTKQPDSAIIHLPDITITFKRQVANCLSLLALGYTTSIAFFVLGSRSCPGRTTDASTTSMSCHNPLVHAAQRPLTASPSAPAVIASSNIEHLHMAEGGCLKLMDRHESPRSQRSVIYELITQDPGRVSKSDSLILRKTVIDLIRCFTEDCLFLQTHSGT